MSKIQPVRRSMSLGQGKDKSAALSRKSWKKLSFMRCNPSTSSLAYRANIYMMESQMAQAKYSLQFRVYLKMADRKELRLKLSPQLLRRKERLNI